MVRHKRTNCLNFKDEKIDRMYSYITVSLDINETDLLDAPIGELDDKITDMLEHLEETKAVLFRIRVNGIIDHDSVYDLMNRIMKHTIIYSEVKRDYLFVPSWFKKPVNLPILTQKELGNHKNLFEKIQIEIETNNGIERLI